MTHLDTINCRNIAHTKTPMKSFSQWRGNISGIPVIFRKKKCPICGSTYNTVDLPQELAVDVLSEDS